MDSSWPWKGPKPEGGRQSGQGVLAIWLQRRQQLSRRLKGKGSQSRAQEELLFLHLLVMCGPRWADLVVTVAIRLVKRVGEARKSSSQARKRAYCCA